MNIFQEEEGGALTQSSIVMKLSRLKAKVARLICNRISQNKSEEL